jgi:hypothetical protein
MAQKPKVTDEQFIEAYMAAQGSYEGTAGYIQQNYDVPFTRQAAMKRAKQFPNLKRDVLELMENEFDDHLLKFASDGNNDIRLRARIYLQLKNQVSRLNNKVEKTNKFGAGIQPTGYRFFDFDDNIISFDDAAHDKEAFERIKQGLAGAGLEAYLEERRKKFGDDGLQD